MSLAYRNAIAAHGAAVMRFMGLVDQGGNELTGGTPAYRRISVSWTEPDDGAIRPSANLLFHVPAGSTVAGWRGYAQQTGGPEYGGADLTPESFSDQGQYEVLAAKTAVRHVA